MITTLVTILHIAACLILIVVILIQGGRGQGLSGPSFSSGNVQSLFGTQAADFMTKATTVAAICFLFTCIGLNIVETHKSKSLLQGYRQTAPVDVEAVKKALEKVKAESAQKAGTTAQAIKSDASQASAKTSTAANTVTQAATSAAAPKTAPAVTPAPTKPKS